MKKYFFTLITIISSIAFGKITYSSVYGAVCSKLSEAKPLAYALMGSFKIHNSDPDMFDESLVKLSEEEVLNTIIQRVSIYDSIKSQILKNEVNNLWNSSDFRSGIVITNPELKKAYSFKNECEIERAFVFNNDGHLIVSSDVFNLLSGYERVFLKLQAYYLKNVIMHNPNAYTKAEDLARFHFSKTSIVDNLSDYVKNYIIFILKPGHIHYLEFNPEIQIGNNFYSFMGIHQVEFNPAFYENKMDILSAFFSRPKIISLATNDNVIANDLVRYWPNGNYQMIQIKPQVIENIIGFNPDLFVSEIYFDSNSEIVAVDFERSYRSSETFELETLNSGVKKFSNYNSADEGRFYFKNKKLYKVCNNQNDKCKIY